MNTIKHIKLKIDWKNKFTGRISVSDGNGDPNDEFVLLNMDHGDLSKSKFRKQIVEQAVKSVLSESSTPDEAEQVTKLLNNMLMEEVEKRSSSVGNDVEPKKANKGFQLLPDRACDTDLANAERFAHFYGANVRWCERLKSWFWFDGRRWQEDFTQAVGRAAKQTALQIYDEVKVLPHDQQKSLAKHARDSQNHSRLNAMLSLAKPLLPVQPQEFDQNDFLMPVENGVVDLRNGYLMAYEPSQFLTKLAPVIYNPTATCPQFEAFIHQITLGRSELVDYIQRLLGMSMTGDISYQALPIFYGSGCNGKSTLIDVYKAILGEFVTMAPESLLTTRTSDEHPTELADLQGRRLVIGNESDEGRKLRLSLVKRLTGDEWVKARRMRCDYYEFRRTNKTILVTNNKPRLTEDDAAIRRRIKLIPFEFNAKVAGIEDPHLKAKLLAEKSGILNWLIAGCLRWQQFGMSEPAIVQYASDQYFSEENPLTEFLELHCVVGVDAYVVNADLYNAYLKWADVSGNKFPLGQKSFYKRIATQFGEAKQKKVNANNLRCFVGVGLKAGANVPPVLFAA